MQIFILQYEFDYVIIYMNELEIINIQGND
jgi:hypothetical protein